MLYDLPWRAPPPASKFLYLQEVRPEALGGSCPATRAYYMPCGSG